VSAAPPDDPRDPLFAAWAEALPRVLAILPGQQRGQFRHVLQRFLATARFDAAGAAETAAQLHEMLLESLRAARAPAAIHATRATPPEPATLVRLCEQILAAWRDAEAAAAAEPGSAACAPEGLSGEVFFGPRLGGKGRSPS
jgi:hypothetical protein